MNSARFFSEERLRKPLPAAADTSHLFVLDEAQLVNQRIQQAIATHTRTHHPLISLCLLDSVHAPAEKNLFSVFHDFLLWPCSVEELSARLNRFNTYTSANDSPAVDEHLLNQFANMHLVGRSQRFVGALQLIKKTAQCHAPVLIQGETGTGKENAARAIHYLSPRANHAFVPINCGALPDDLLESELFGHEKGAFTDAKSFQPGLVKITEGGTLFLDEVDCLSSKAQAALLRFLQTQEYRPIGSSRSYQANVRIIAATNADLNQLVSEGRFREDLLYRLNVLLVTMPPLRQRAEDIPLLVDSLLQKFAGQYGGVIKPVAQSTLIWLMHQPWPGNVRELENILLRQFLLSDQATLTIGHGSETPQVPPPPVNASDTPHNTIPGISPSTPASAPPSTSPLKIDTSCSFQQAKSDAIHQFERHYLRQLLQQAGGNISEAARISGKERRALGKMLKKYGIGTGEFRS
ncbi:sigma-54 interaction domain-containing protein [Pseudomaricurvus alcaniphilus]|uniref:sigma-54 interaction domain-containing protein n=1 Tax=Pseudomaricurvus alcaniphilus TaxID=1166482 RepID=UPI001A9EFD6F|nr:sigma-54 dependent transcriptional regulator [Pseudomaricurvus alcaniphilus]